MKNKKYQDEVNNLNKTHSSLHLMASSKTEISFSMKNDSVILTET